MSLLISLLFLLLSTLYILTAHCRPNILASYVSGIIVGIGSIPMALLLKFNFYASCNIFLNAFSYFSFYFLIPASFGLLLYFLCNLKSFEVKTSSVALQGIWTVFLFFASYEMAKIPDNTMYFIFFASYFLVILFFEFLLQNLKIERSIVLFFISYIFSMSLAFFACFAFVLWLYKYSPIIYLGIPIVFNVLFFFLLIISKKEKC